MMATLMDSFMKKDMFMICESPFDEEGTPRKAWCALANGDVKQLVTQRRPARISVPLPTEEGQCC
jgi:hypothetical protein